MSGSLERTLALELSGLDQQGKGIACNLEKKLEVIFGMGWSLVGREFAFELMNQLVPKDDGMTPAFRTAVRNLSHTLVEMQEKELAQDRVAAEILEPIGHKASSGNPLALGSALEISLNYDLSFDATETEVRQAHNLLEESLREEKGHWGLRCLCSGCCPVCGAKVQNGDSAVVFGGGEVYHERCCPEDVAVSKMPTLVISPL